MLERFYQQSKLHRLKHQAAALKVELGPQEAAVAEEGAEIGGEEQDETMPEEEGKAEEVEDKEYDAFAHITAEQYEKLLQEFGEVEVKNEKELRAFLNKKEEEFKQAQEAAKEEKKEGEEHQKLADVFPKEWMNLDELMERDICRYPRAYRIYENYESYVQAHPEASIQDYHERSKLPG